MTDQSVNPSDDGTPDAEWPGRLGWHPDEDEGDDDIVQRFENLPILLQRALVRLAYVVIDSSPQETQEADTFFNFLSGDDSPLWESPKRQLRVFQEVRSSVALHVRLNQHERAQETG